MRMDHRRDACATFSEERPPLAVMGHHPEISASAAAPLTISMISLVMDV
jgi:hypothetical protein